MFYSVSSAVFWGYLHCQLLSRILLPVSSTLHLCSITCGVSSKTGQLGLCLVGNYRQQYRHSRCRQCSNRQWESGARRASLTLTALHPAGTCQYVKPRAWLFMPYLFICKYTPSEILQESKRSGLNDLKSIPTSTRFLKKTKSAKSFRIPTRR